MSHRKTPAEKIYLGGGITFFPGKMMKNSPRACVPGAVYSLGLRDAFCVDLDGLATDVITCAKLGRLEEIAQLQLLSTLRLHGCGIRGLYPHTFGHNRLAHSQRVAAIALLMAKHCGFSDKKKLVVAGLLHDAFTCAGGDSWKDINCQGTLFDEDNNFANKIFRYFGKGWKTLCARYGWDPGKMAAEIADIVAGKGLLGGLQEIADTASYMLGDLEEIRRAARRHKNSRDFARILQAAEQPWDVWNHISIGSGQAVVTDPVTLNTFLFLRILLWVDFYQNPQHKFLEGLMQRIIYPYLVDKKAIKISELPTKDDRWLYGVISRQMGWADIRTQCLDLLGRFPQLKAFACMADALAWEEEKYRAGAATLIYDARQFPPIKTKVDKYFVVGKNGSPQTFAEVYPTHAEAISQIARQATAPEKSVQVAWVEKPNISDNYRRAWESARARWRKPRTD